MARHHQDEKMARRSQNHSQRVLHYLLNETYTKIDELKKLLNKEASITGMATADAAVGRMFSRQDYLVTLCAEACIEHENRGAVATTGAGHNVISGISHKHSASNSAAIEDQPDGSWYGSLDRSFGMKRKHQLYEKRRRHTKTIGSMAGLDVIKQSNELKPDEQYEIGLPVAPKVTSSRSSIFPMTQHQYYTALMESKLAKKTVYPLEVVKQTHALPPVLRTQKSWNYSTDKVMDENKNVRKHQSQVRMSSIHHPNLQTFHRSSKSDIVTLTNPTPESNDLKISNSEFGNSIKTWYETNLDGCAKPTNISQNPSPSPSVLSSTQVSPGGSITSVIDTVDGGVSHMVLSSPANESTEMTSKSSESSESWSGVGNEVTKPFEMSDYYKYSTKFRSRNSPVFEDDDHYEPRNSLIRDISPTLNMHSRQTSQIHRIGIDEELLRDTNQNPVVPKLPPKQNRNQNSGPSSASTVCEELTDTAEDAWITNEPTFV